MIQRSMCLLGCIPERQPVFWNRIPNSTRRVGGYLPKSALMIGVVLVVLIALPGIACADDFVGGIPLSTVQTGTVTGDLWFDATPAPNWGLQDVTKTFTLPENAAGNITWARLYISAYDGHMQDDKAFIITNKFDGNGDGTYEQVWPETGHAPFSYVTNATTYEPEGNDNTALGGGAHDRYKMINDHENRVTSDYFMWYDVTNLISSRSVNVNVNTVGSFDGRIKVITLVVAYNDPSSTTQTTYWVNQGHDVCSYYTEDQGGADDGASHVAVGTTSFATTGLSGISSATLTVDYMASNNGNYGFPTAQNNFNPSTKTGDFTNINLDRSSDVQGAYSGLKSWDVTSSVSGSGSTTLAYARYLPGTGTSAFYKIPLAFLVVKSPRPATIPVTAFTTSVTNGLAPVTATFTDVSTNTPTSWLWEYRLADNGTWATFSTVQNPSHEFTGAGTYDIRLTATNAGGSNTVTKTHVFAAALEHDYLTTVQSGTVSGDLFISSANPWGSAGGSVSTQSYTLPASGSNISWARLYVNVYSGSGATNYPVLVKTEFDADGDGTFEDTLGTETCDIMSGSTGYAYPLNDHVTKVYSDYETWYDVTPLITSSTPKVRVTTSAVPGKTLYDGRIKGITLVVAYNDGDSDQVKYWVNHGNDWMTGSSSTSFATNSLEPGWSSAEMRILSFSSSDAGYTLNGNSITKTSGTTGSYYRFNTFNTTGNLAAGSSNTVGYINTGTSFKTCLAALTVRYAVPPVAGFTADHVAGTSPLTVQFTDHSANSPASWAWDFNDDGVTDSTQQNPTYTFTSPGVYTVKLTVTNAAGSDDEIKIGYITVNPEGIRTERVINGGFETGNLNGWTVYMLNNHPQFILLNNETYPDHTTHSGSYFAWFDTVEGNTLSISQLIDLTGVDDITFWSMYGAGKGTVRIDSNTVLSGISDDYSTWTLHTIDTSSYSGNHTLEFYYQNDGDGWLIDDISAIAVTQLPVAAFSGSPTSGTAPLMVQFTDASINTPTSWSWDFGDGSSTNATIQNPVHTYSSAGTYTVKLTATNSAGSNTATQTNYITVSSTPVVVVLPGLTNPPTDPNDDGQYEDLNGDGEIAFPDLQLYFAQMDWIASNEPIAAFDYSRNGEIDFPDLQALFAKI